MAGRESYSVEWDGIPHVLACLHALDERAETRLDDTLGDAAETVAQRTRAVIPLGPIAAGHAQASVRVDRDRLDATVSEGGVRFPYLPWLEFGGNVGRKHAVHRQWIHGGRYMFRALSTIKPGLEPALHEAMRRAARDSGWDPDG